MALLQGVDHNGTRFWLLGDPTPGEQVGIDRHRKISGVASKIAKATGKSWGKTFDALLNEQFKK